ncbi:GntR family transcriptional regulator [Sediminispirochaeta smaragdinae]|uniref:Transcriptional regulator, GntR family n=1 Tax=Sediminispirochaeta smaragdinae (strain DSM 11293 / JCM 15392 / SEBR 4228) TaxID=573413 RepID=E1R3V8_SEDSS|nr:GntR family transcriptional regulator [Sediminispirochaeta smaragdinae]ADK82079.1 transcriptional regulator, GntR family [Sediminispirochaeta smaragdinae DSM 11293]
MRKTQSIRVEASPLYVKTKEALIELILSRNFSGNRLPSETTLCEMLGVGRTTLREALMALNREGVITKKHGLGNLIHRTTLNAKMRIDTIHGFRKLLEDGGYRVSCKRTSPRWVTSIEVEGIDCSNCFEERFLLVENRYFADGHPAIYGHNYLCGSFVRESEAQEILSYQGSFYDLLGQFLTEEVANSINTFRPAIATAPLAEILDVGVGDPLIQWQESFIGIFDHIVCRSLISFNPAYVDLTLLRKWT